MMLLNLMSNTIHSMLITVLNIMNTVFIVPIIMYTVHSVINIITFVFIIRLSIFLVINIIYSICNVFAESSIGF